MEPLPELRRIEENSNSLAELRPSPNTEFEYLDSKVRFLWIISRGIFWLIIFAVLTPIFLAGAFEDVSQIWLLTGMAVLGFLSFLHLSWPIFSFRCWGFAIRRTDFLLRSGVIWKSVIAVPFNRIQHVDTNAGPIERSFGLANLVIHTAGSHLGSVRVPGLPSDYAASLRDYLSEVGHSHANI